MINKIEEHRPDEPPLVASEEQPAGASVPVVADYTGLPLIPSGPSMDDVRLDEQTERLRDQLIHLIPAQDGLANLSNLREPYRLQASLLSPKRSSLSSPLSNTSRLQVQESLSELTEIQARLRSGLDTQPEWLLLQKQLIEIDNQVRSTIAQLNALLKRLIYTNVSSMALIESMVSKIGHRELREEAKMHLGVAGELLKKLDIDLLARVDNDVLGDETQAAVGVMTELERHRLVVEQLVISDRARRTFTVTVVVAYIALVIGAFTLAMVRWGPTMLFGQASLVQQRLPLIGIPWPVIVWSFLGSFAAMVYRFNRRPIYDFGDAVKWMLTRPFQGVVLVSAFYLVLVSGLFLLTGGATGTSSGVGPGDEVILVLAFLVSFSDRFADGIFTTLVDTYGVKKDPVAAEKEEDA